MFLSKKYNSRPCDSGARNAFFTNNSKLCHACSLNTNLTQIAYLWINDEADPGDCDEEAARNVNLKNVE